MHPDRCTRALGSLFMVLWLTFGVATLWAREHKKKPDFGTGFSAEIAAPEDVVRQAVEAVVEDGIIRGSAEYSKDQYIEHAGAASSSPLFSDENVSGDALYKIRMKVLAPANFKEAADEGTLAVRYVIQSKDPGKTILRIDAVFAEDVRHTVHPSNGSVENAEYKDIQDRVDAIELQKTQAQDADRRRQDEMARKALEQKQEDEETAALARAQTSVQDLEQHVHLLKQKAERIVKAPGAELKSAPFHTASSLKSVEAGTEVVIVISTPYWYGVETEDGQHGWIHHQQLEPLP